MKPAAFDYRLPGTVEEAVALLAAADNAKVIAGGQSLVPMLNFRLVAPDLLVDIARLPTLGGIWPRNDGGLGIGALTRHRDLELSAAARERFPVVTEAVRSIGHLAIRNRGTVGGSLVHADPAAEWPMLALLLDARMRIAGPDGFRELAAGDFFLGTLTVDLAAAELLVGIELPALPAGTVCGFAEFARRTGDFALCGVAVTLTPHSQGGGRPRFRDARIALIGVDETSVRIPDAERLLLECSSLDADLIEAVAAVVRASIKPTTDTHASADYRCYLAYNLTKRTLMETRTRHAL